MLPTNTLPSAAEAMLSVKLPTQYDQFSRRRAHTRRGGRLMAKAPDIRCQSLCLVGRELRPTHGGIGLRIASGLARLPLSISEFRRSCHRSTTISCRLDRGPMATRYHSRHGSRYRPLRRPDRGRCDRPEQPSPASHRQGEERLHLDECLPAVWRGLRRHGPPEPLRLDTELPPDGRSPARINNLPDLPPTSSAT